MLKLKNGKLLINTGGDWYPVTLYRASYVNLNDAPALAVVGDSPYDFTMLSVGLDVLKSNHNAIALDANMFDLDVRDVQDILIELGIIAPSPPIHVRQGFVTYPMYTLITEQYAQLPEIN